MRWTHRSLEVAAAVPYEAAMNDPAAIAISLSPLLRLVLVLYAPVFEAQALLKPATVTMDWCSYPLPEPMTEPVKSADIALDSGIDSSQASVVLFEEYPPSNADSGAHLSKSSTSS